MTQYFANQAKAEQTAVQAKNKAAFDAALEGILEGYGLSDTQMSPEKWMDFSHHLVGEVMEDAIRTLEFASTSWQTKLECAEWLMSDSPANPFAFRNVCMILCVRPDEMREQILMRPGVRRGMAQVEENLGRTLQ